MIDTKRRRCEHCTGPLYAEHHLSGKGEEEYEVLCMHCGRSVGTYRAMCSSGRHRFPTAVPCPECVREIRSQERRRHPKIRSNDKLKLY